MVDGLLDATRELLGKPLTKKQKELAIEPARASLTEKTTYAAIAAKEVADKGGAQGPIRLEGRHEGGEGHLLRRKTGMRDVDNVSIRAYPDKEDRI